MGYKFAPSPDVAKGIIAAFEEAFSLNPFCFSAADGLIVIYGLSGPEAKDRMVEWMRKRDQVLDTLSISMECASKQPLLSKVWENDLRQHAGGGIPPFLELP